MQTNCNAIFLFSRVFCTVSDAIRTLCVEEVQHGDDHSMATEHVVTTGAHALQRHAKTTPDLEGPLHFRPDVIKHLQMHRHRILHESAQLARFLNELLKFSCSQRSIHPGLYYLVFIKVIDLGTYMCNIYYLPCQFSLVTSYIIYSITYYIIYNNFELYLTGFLPCPWVRTRGVCRERTAM